MIYLGVDNIYMLCNTVALGLGYFMLFCMAGAFIVMVAESLKNLVVSILNRLIKAN